MPGDPRQSGGLGPLLHGPAKIKPGIDPRSEQHRGFGRLVVPQDPTQTCRGGSFGREREGKGKKNHKTLRWGSYKLPNGAVLINLMTFKNSR